MFDLPEIPREVFMAAALLPMMLASMFLAVLYLCMGLPKSDILFMIVAMNFLHWAAMENQHYHVSNCIAATWRMSETYFWLAIGPVLAPPVRWVLQGAGWLLKKLWEVSYGAYCEWRCDADAGKPESDLRAG